MERQKSKQQVKVFQKQSVRIHPPSSQDCRLLLPNLPDRTITSFYKLLLSLCSAVVAIAIFFFSSVSFQIVTQLNRLIYFSIQSYQIGPHQRKYSYPDLKIEQQRQMQQCNVYKHLQIFLRMEWPFILVRLRCIFFDTVTEGT